MKKRRKQPETRGRPAIPPDLRKVTLVCRVPQRVLTGFDARAKAHGTDQRGKPKSSRGLEVERAFERTEPCQSRVPDGELNAQLRRWSHAGLE